MLTAGGRAPPFGDLANCATAAGAGAGIESSLQTFLHEVGGVQTKIMFPPASLLCHTLDVPQPR